MESTEGPPVLCRLPLLETKPSLGRRILSGAGQHALVLPELAVCGENSASKKIEKTPTGRIRELRKGLLEMGSLERRHSEKKEYSPQAVFHNENEKQRLNGSASMYSEIQRERAEIGGLMARPEYREWNPELIKPKKLLNPVKASRTHQEMHRELLMNHRRGLGVDSKPELQRVLEHRRRNQLIKKKKEELEAKRLQCPFEQELLRRQQRLNQLEKPPEKEEDHAPEFIKVRENLRRITTLTSGERAL
ncbi:hypothetical protein G4228_015969 [Cervus hanglu yarkandensis]|nr:hypothetical protein G4228_015969 [Cervus hanglu yarkandensis]